MDDEAPVVDECGFVITAKIQHRENLLVIGDESVNDAQELQAFS